MATEINFGNLDCTSSLDSSVGINSRNNHEDEGNFQRPRELMCMVPMQHISNGGDVSDNVIRNLDSLRASLNHQGYLIIDIFQIMGALSCVMNDENLELPAPNLYGKPKGKQEKRQAREQSKFTDQLFDRITISLAGDQCIGILCDETDITESVTAKIESPEGLQEVIGMIGHNAWMNGIGRFYRGNKFQNIRTKIEAINGKLGLIDVSDRTYLFDENCAVVSVGLGMNEIPVNMRGGVDTTIRINGEENNVSEALDEAGAKIDFYNRVRDEYEQHKLYLNDGFPRIESDSSSRFATHPLMDHVKKEVGRAVKELLAEEDLLIDPSDLMYQILFRLTSYEITDTFQEGDTLEQHLIEVGAYDSWEGILAIDSEFASGFHLNSDILERVMSEQLLIIQERIARSSLSEEEIQRMLGRYGIFKEQQDIVERKLSDDDHSDEWRIETSEGFVRACRDMTLSEYPNQLDEVSPDALFIRVDGKVICVDGLTDECINVDPILLEFITENCFTTGSHVERIRLEKDGEGIRVFKSINVDFRSVGLEVAKEIHNAFHYIHTPRATIAFGLFLEGEDDLPFSVVAFDEIDREYKQKMLMLRGHIKGSYLDLARLYSRPGTPFNTSSTIFSLSFAYFREHMPEIEAVLSAFMPTYAHGMSMVSAGFEDCALMKPGSHTFEPVDLDGQTVWEHKTKRRLSGNSEHDHLNNQWPLLPVVELYAPLRKPGKRPINGKQAYMHNF